MRKAMERTIFDDVLRENGFSLSSLSERFTNDSKDILTATYVFKKDEQEIFISVIQDQPVMGNLFREKEDFRRTFFTVERLREILKG